jgi:hypothetical protein
MIREKETTSQDSQLQESRTNGTKTPSAVGTTAHTPVQLPTRTMVSAIQIGTVLLMLGVGLLLNSWTSGRTGDLNMLRKASECGYWGTLAVAVGVGALLGVAVVYFYRLLYVLARRYLE